MLVTFALLTAHAEITWDTNLECSEERIPVHGATDVPVDVKPVFACHRASNPIFKVNGAVRHDVLRSTGEGEVSWDLGELPSGAEVVWDMDGRVTIFTVGTEVAATPTSPPLLAVASDFFTDYDDEQETTWDVSVSANVEMAHPGESVHFVGDGWQTTSSIVNGRAQTFVYNKRPSDQVATCVTAAVRGASGEFGPPDSLCFCFDEDCGGEEEESGCSTAPPLGALWLGLLTVLARRQQGS